MRRSRRWAWGLLALTVLLAGCLKFKRVEDEKAISLAAGDVQPLMEMDAQPKDMDLTVTATTAPAVPLTLYLVASDDAAAVMEDISTGHESAKVIAKSGQSTAPTLQGVAPAGKKCTVVAANGGKTGAEVKAKILGKY